MSSHDLPPEQDADGGDNLPTYDDLAERQGPNSRFGRWRSWIEKRAAERYADVTPEEFQRRRDRGWDIEDDTDTDLSIPTITAYGPTTPSTSTGHPQLRLQTDWKTLPNIPIEPDEETLLDPEQPLISQSLAPTHLGLNQFGSRFLPHATSPIRTLLPLLGDSLLLVGHDDGLSVINMFPQEWTEFGLRNKGPGEAEAHRIWTGEGVFQMSVLEVENIGESTPQGVVLLLVSSETESSNNQENHRTLRMYNLASLISLAKWAVAQKGVRPLDMRRPAYWKPQQTSSKKHKSSGSLARGLKSLMISESSLEASTSYHTMLPSLSAPSTHDPRRLDRQASTESGWDIVDELPLRWATDYVPLASTGSRLANASVLAYDVWRDETSVRGGALLAVATKSGVLLYESPKGERAFRLVKDFYTPLSPRNIVFVHQNVSDTLSRTPSDTASLSQQPSLSYGHVRLSLVASPSPSRSRHISLTPQSVTHGPQLSLFVMFDKKAGLIRVSDSAVGEVELYEEGRELLSPTVTLNHVSARRARTSMDGHKDAKGTWALPSKLDLSETSAASDAGQSVYLLTRGRQTRVLPCPLPANLSSTPPLHTFSWRSPASYVTPRIIAPQRPGGRPCLQLIAFGEDGLEVQESSLSVLSNGKDKGRMEEPLYSQTDFGGATGFLQEGGHWHRPYDAPLSRSQSSRSAVSFDSLATEEIASKLHADQGIYGWQRRGFEDWRVFWVGGTSADRRTQEYND